jgi:hypothetical protein
MEIAQMEFAQIEVNVEEKSKVKAEENRIQLLSDFQLSLIGGGCGEVIFG